MQHFSIGVVRHDTSASRGRVISNFAPSPAIFQGADYQNFSPGTCRPLVSKESSAIWDLFGEQDTQDREFSDKTLCSLTIFRETNPKGMRVPGGF